MIMSGKQFFLAIHLGQISFYTHIKHDIFNYETNLYLKLENAVTQLPKKIPTVS